jgi:hypothetical protein
MTSKLTRLRVQDCGNGDECPALDRREDGGVEVTGEFVHRPGLPPGEGVVLVPDTLLPEIASLHVHLGEFIAEHHRTDLLRVQTRDHYGVASDDEDYSRYLAGEDAPLAAGKQEWLARLRTDTDAGRIRRNVHVARMRYGAGGEFQGAVAAGADAAEGYVALAEMAWTLATPFTTWWAEHPQFHRHNTAA